MAGHSKFANIKHRKERNDSKKGKVFTKLGRELAMAVKHGGGPVPASNSKLRDAIAKAKSMNMPNDTIERFLKKAAGADQESYEAITYEGYGPSGVAVIVRVLTDNRNRAASNVRSAFTKGGGNLGTPGCVAYLFNEAGHIMIEAGCGFGEDELMLFAADAGADDFSAIEGGFEIVTAPEIFSAVREKFEAENVPLSSAGLTMLPSVHASLKTPEEKKLMGKLLELLEDEDDVQDVYHNCEMWE